MPLSRKQSTKAAKQSSKKQMATTTKSSSKSKTAAVAKPPTKKPTTAAPKPVLKKETTRSVTVRAPVPKFEEEKVSEATMLAEKQILAFEAQFKVKAGKVEATVKVLEKQVEHLLVKAEHPDETGVKTKMVEMCNVLLGKRKEINALMSKFTQVSKPWLFPEDGTPTEKTSAFRQSLMNVFDLNEKLRQSKDLVDKLMLTLVHSNSEMNDMLYKLETLSYLDNVLITSKSNKVGGETSSSPVKGVVGVKQLPKQSSSSSIKTKKTVTIKEQPVKESSAQKKAKSKTSKKRRG